MSAVQAGDFCEGRRRSEAVTPIDAGNIDCSRLTVYIPDGGRKAYHHLILSVAWDAQLGCEKCRRSVQDIFINVAQLHGEPVELAHSQWNERGAGRRARTDDLLITNQLLYQLSYTGIYFWVTVYAICIRDTNLHRARERKSQSHRFTVRALVERARRSERVLRCEDSGCHLPEFPRARPAA